MSMMTALWGALAIARMPKAYVSADVEITRLKEEIERLKTQVTALQIALQELARPPAIVDLPGDHHDVTSPLYRHQRLAQIRNCAPGRADFLAGFAQQHAQHNAEQAVINQQQAMINAYQPQGLGGR